MYIVQIASELAPIAKAGGLGDVVLGLSKQLVRLGHKVEVILPKYNHFQENQLPYHPIHKIIYSYKSSTETYDLTALSYNFENFKLTLIDSHNSENFFKRENIYGYLDDPQRFTHFSIAALEYLVSTKQKPNVINIHDWITGSVAPLYKFNYQEKLPQCKIVLTIHNMCYQGVTSPYLLEKVGFEGNTKNVFKEMITPLQGDKINLLKGALNYSDAITVVSPTYAKEIQTPAFGCYLEDIAQREHNKIFGILNGLDTEFWNPSTDKFLTANYPTDSDIKTKEDLQLVLREKRANKEHLFRMLGINDNGGPLVGIVSRLAHQKGLHLIIHTIKETLKRGGCLVLLGSGTNPTIQKCFVKIKKILSKFDNNAFCLQYDEKLAHLIFASSDLTVVPSLYEPCGLTQLIALRYGTIPLVRATGGFLDSIWEGENGFVFNEPTQKDLDLGLDRAFDCYFNDHEKWLKMMKTGMHQEVGWDVAAKEYLKVYSF